MKTLRLPGNAARRRDSSAWPAVGFWLLLSVLAGLLSGLLYLAWFQSVVFEGGSLGVWEPGLPEAAEPPLASIPIRVFPVDRPLITLVSIPISLLFGLFVGLSCLAIIAGISHLLLRGLGARGHPYVATFRTLAYVQSAVAAVGWIPLLGWLAALVGSIVLPILGLREVHQTTTGRVAVAALAPIIAPWVLLGELILLVVALAMFAARMS